MEEYERQRDIPRSQRTLVHSNGSYIEAVQLDAFKAGMEYAALQIRNPDNVNFVIAVLEGDRMRKVIRDATQQLIELPK